MSWKDLSQNNLIDHLVLEHSALQELDELEGLINWSGIEDRLREIHAKKRGEPAWPPLMMFKALLLQSWYQLSDPGLEKQLARDLLFKRFVGLGLDQNVPDHSTIWRFRNLLEKTGLYDTLLNELNDQLGGQGLIIREGEVSIIDASVIEAKQCRPKKNQQGKNTQDPDAAYNVKNGSDGKRKTTYGFKAHLNVEEDGFIKTYELTAGNVHDSQLFETCLTGTESAVYADSAYQSQAHEQLLKDRQIENCILQRAYRNKPLTQAQKQKNRTLSGTRSTVERVFGVLKMHYGVSKARYLGKQRNRAHLGLLCFAHNLKRGLTVQQAC